MFKANKLVVLVVLALFVLVGCETVNDQESDQVDSQQALYARNQPVPRYDWSLERDVSIQLYNIRNEARNTYSVIVAAGTGQPLFVCPSIGYPIPYDVQLTNPLQYDYNGAVVAQAEPNGLFSSQNSDATWVLCVSGAGEVTPIYSEQKVITFPYPVQIINGVIVPVADQAPWVTIQISDGSNQVNDTSTNASPTGD